MHSMKYSYRVILMCLSLLTSFSATSQARDLSRQQSTGKQLVFPPQLPGGATFVTVRDRLLLKRSPQIAEHVDVATEVPTVDFLYLPGQTYAGKPWSNWGDSLAVGDKYYTSIGDHLAPQGNAYVYEYDPTKKKFRCLANTAKTLDLPAGHYMPGKIHTRLDRGADGWIYFGTHRGSTRATTDVNRYQGDWIMRCDPQTANCEVVARCPIAKHCIPTGMVDGQRMVFYGSTAAGSDAPSSDIHFFAYDLARRKTLYAGRGGPSRAMVLSQTTGRVYFTPDKADSPLMRFDPTKDKRPQTTDGTIGIRAASRETKDGIVYTVASGQKNAEPTLFAFHPRSEKIEALGTATVGTQSYITSLDVDPSGRYLYYVPGAHGGSHRDGTPIVQFDTRLRKKKVLAFLEPYFSEKLGCSLRGTYSVALAPAGDKLFITWNASRGSRHWDCCALTVLHIPATERLLN